MFRRLPPAGSNNPRAVAEILNGVMDGKTNNTGSVTLATGGASTTTITDARIGANSVILLMPTDDVSSTAYTPYLAVQDTTDQAAANTTSENIITFNTTDYALGTILVDSTKLKVDYAGLYNIQFSIQLINTTNDVQELSVWFKKNGTNIAASNSEFGISQRKSTGTASRLIATLNFFVALQKNDYIELAWRPTDIGLSIEHFAAQTTPTRPVTPSVIATMAYLSSNGYTSNLFTDPYISSVSNGSAIISHPANSISGKTYKYVVVG
jgi:hypothetical protein